MATVDREAFGKLLKEIVAQGGTPCILHDGGKIHLLEGTVDRAYGAFVKVKNARLIRDDLEEA